jgi:tRNA-dihydrouridine synthase
MPTNAIPVSVKTRIGYNKIDLEWTRFLLEQRLPAMTIHLRTRKEMSDVPAHWELMPEIVKTRDEVQRDLPINERTLIIGNGDVESIVKGQELVAKTGCDGIMIGRGIFGTPWLFEDLKSQRSNLKISDIEAKKPAFRLKILLEHAKLFEKAYCGKNGKRGIKSFAVMKKHFKAYVSGWDGAKELRAKLMERNNFKEVQKTIVDNLRLQNPE